MTLSWFGTYTDAFQAIAKAGTDVIEETAIQDNFAVSATHAYRVEGEFVVGLGGQELIIGPEVFYFVDGEPKPLLELLRSRGAGVVCLAI